MPLDVNTGVFFEVHGPSAGRLVMVTLPLMASFGAIFGSELEPVLDGYLSKWNIQCYPNLPVPLLGVTEAEPPSDVLEEPQSVAARAVSCTTAVAGPPQQQHAQCGNLLNSQTRRCGKMTRDMRGDRACTNIAKICR